jgi:hypothetical protein
MQRGRFVIIAAIAWLCIVGYAYAEGGYHQPREMIQKSQFIAIITIESVAQLPKPEHPRWHFGQRAQAVVERNVKGALPRTIDIYGGENFVCQETTLSPGRYLAFLVHSVEGYLESANYQMGIRPLRGNKVEWYYDNGRGTLSSNFGYSLRWQHLDSLLRHIGGTQRPNHAMERTADR